jgi:tetratricopeptide (TPR) repeat protein
MKQTFFILTALTLFFGCRPRQNNMNNFMADIQEDFSKHAEQQNRKVYAWEEKIETLYKRADKNLQDGVDYADSLIKNDNTLGNWDISNLHTIVGELYYDNDSITPALARFHQGEILTFDSPRNQANKAGCYIKQGDLEKAMILLEQAAQTNHDFKWYIGNLYEIKGEPEKAILEYDYVYQRDTNVYAYYNQRIKELRTNPDQLMTELYYKDRRKRMLLLLKGIDSDTSETAIGRFEIEKK